MGGHRDRAAASEQRGDARVLQDRLQVTVLILDEERLAVQLAKVANEVHRAPRQDAQRQHGKGDRHAPCARVADERPAEERHRHPHVQHDRRHGQVARDHGQSRRGDRQEERQADTHESGGDRHPPAQDVHAEKTAKRTDVEVEDLLVRPQVVGNQRDRLRHAALAAELAGHVARGRQRVEGMAGDDPVGRRPQHRRERDHTRRDHELSAGQGGRQPEPVHAGEHPCLRP